MSLRLCGDLCWQSVVRSDGQNLQAGFFGGTISPPTLMFPRRSGAILPASQRKSSTKSALFKVFGITLPAFKIAGGIILLLIGIDMLQARRSPTNEVAGESQEAAEKEDVSVIPLGIPMLAGPGSISTVIVLMGETGHWWHVIPVFTAIAVTSIASYAVLAAADRVRQYLGHTGIRILMRFMGLLLMGVAIQFIINGFTDVGLVHPR